MHNKGLADIISRIKKENFDQMDKAAITDLIIDRSLKASNSQENATAIKVTEEYVSFVSTSINNYRKSGFYELTRNESQVLPDSIWEALSTSAQTYFLKLIYIQDNYLDLDVLKTEVDTFLKDLEADNLIHEEKLALYSGAYTTLYSNEYWDENLALWLDLINDEKNKTKVKMGWRDHVKADIGGECNLNSV